jgi:hypothetical protein
MGKFTNGDRLVEAVAGNGKSCLILIHPNQKETEHEDLLHSHVVLVDIKTSQAKKKISYLASQQRVRQRMGSDQEKGTR